MQSIPMTRAKKLFFFFILILIFSLTGLAAANFAFMATDNIYEGVSVGNLPLGGKSLAEAEQLLEQHFQQRAATAPLSLQHQSQSWQIQAQEIDLSIDAHELAAQAYAIGRHGNLLTQWQERYLSVHHGYVLPLKMHYNQNKLQTIVTKIAASIEKPPKDAMLTQGRERMEIIPEEIGSKVDISASLQAIATKLEEGIPALVTLTVVTTEPAVYARDLQDIDAVIASYTTHFNPLDKNRTQNIVLAAKNINQVLLRKGEEFSFNRLVGPRLAEYGYKEAPVFVDGKLTLDWGGGVCQVSSTLYNAALLADMSIEERSSHFQPASYVPLGQDAAVADNLLDLRFKNNTAFNVYIRTEVYQGQIIVTMFGNHTANRNDIRIITANKKVLEPTVVVKQDPTLELGKEIIDAPGQKGFQVTTYRVKSLNGKEVEREMLSYDEFKPEDRIIRVGAKVLSSQPTK